MKCWEFSKCGREAGGTRSEELGICPAFAEDAGEACWMVAGTFSQGEVRALLIGNAERCTRCEFYKMHSIEKRADTMARYNHHSESIPTPSDS